MKQKTTKPRLLLLDANIVIKAYELAIWDTLIEHAEVAVPSIVAHDEALFYSSKSSTIPPEINLPALIEQGKILELSATTEELKAIQETFDRSFRESVHAGELEALALIQGDKAEGYYFCTSDKVAIQALAMIDRAYHGISLEKVLISLGLQKSLCDQFREKFFGYWIQKGQQRKITGDGLARN